MAVELKVSDIVNLFKQYQTNYNEITNRLDISLQGARKYIEMKEEIPKVFETLNDVQYRLGRYENRENLSDRGGLVDAKAFSAMEQSLTELQDRWLAIQNMAFSIRVISSAIIYWKDSAIGKYVYVAAKENLYKLKRIDEKIIEVRDLVNQAESLRNKISATSDFWPKYEILKSKLKEMEDIRTLITIQPDELDLLYKQFGLGLTDKAIITIVVTSVVIVALTVLIAYLFTLVAGTVLAGAIWALSKGISEGKKIWQEFYETSEKKEQKAEVEIEKAKSSTVEQTQHVLADPTLSAEQKADVIKSINQNERDTIASINQKLKDDKKELRDNAMALTDKILVLIEGWGNTVLIGAGIFAGVIGLIIVVPRIWPKKKETV